MLSKFNMPMLWVVIGSVIVVGYMRISALSESLENERNVSAQLTESVKTLENSYTEFATQVKDDLRVQNQINTAMVQEQFSNRMQLEQLKSTFTVKANGEARDMDKLLEGKPTLMQRRINDATKKIGGEVESVTNYSTK